MNPSSLFLVAVVALVVAAVPPVLAQNRTLNKNIFPEGAFEITSEAKRTPEGWSFPNIHDKPWAAGNRAEAIKDDAGNTVLRIVRVSAPAATLVAAKVPLPEHLAQVRVSFRLWAKDLTLGDPDPAGNGAGIYARFYDAQGQAIKGTSGWIGGSVKVSSPDWQKLERIYDLPAEVKYAEFHMIFRGASGEVQFDDLEVVPLAFIEP